METRDPVTFPILSAEEIEILRPMGSERTFADGDALWEAGDTDFSFFVILSGRAIIRNSIGDGPQVATHDVGEFTGDVDVMSGRPSPIGGYAEGETRVLQISAENLREVVKVEQDLGGKILLAFIRRRETLLESSEHGVLLVGSTFDPETQHIREFLGRNRVVHRWRQPEDPQTADILKAFNLSAKDTPILFVGQQRLTHPKLETVADQLGIRSQTDKGHYDLVIIGAGPAGLAAAVYGASEGLNTLLLDRLAPGGQASWSSRIENYMGFPEGLTGSDLASRGFIQAQKFGAQCSIPADVTKIECDKLAHQIHLATGETISARAVLVATGANYQKLPIPGFSTFETCGIYYAATSLEAGFCKESEVMVVGAGNSAGQAAVYLSKHAKSVRLVVRGDRLNKAMSDYLSYRVEQIPNISVHLGTEIAELKGGERLESAVLKGATAREVECDGLFVFIGATPNTQFLIDTLALDENGFILTGDTMRSSWKESRDPYYLESSCPGIMAAGDCREGSVKRVASSVGEGSMAVTFVHHILAL